MMARAPRRRRVAGGEAPQAEDARGRRTKRRSPKTCGPAPDVDALEDVRQEPEPQTVLIFVAADVDRTRRLYKALQKQATIVECWGLKRSKDERVDLRQVARQAEQLVRQAVTDAGQQIDPAAASLVAERAGTDIARLRGDVERLLLYAAGKPRITVADAREVVSAEIAQDDWAVTNAICAATPPRRCGNSGCRSSPARFRS